MRLQICWGGHWRVVDVVLHNGVEQVAHDLWQTHVGVHGADELTKEHRFFVVVAREIMSFQPIKNTELRDLLCI